MARGLISPADLALFTIVHSAEAAVEEIHGFFRNYHSLRIVGDQMVFRLHHQLLETELRQLNQEFSDLLKRGVFEQGDALAEEWDEPEISIFLASYFGITGNNWVVFANASIG